MTRDFHASLLLRAIELSRNCPPSVQAFSVGAILTDGAGKLIATGYSRELNVYEHAEELAIRRALEASQDLTGAVLYSSMEPCSIRLSGRQSCTDRVITCGIALVVFAMVEPPLFVVCKGAEMLRQHGVEVLVLDEYAALVVDVNRHLLGHRSP